MLVGYAPISPRFSGAAYRAAILDYVSRLDARGIIVVLRLSGAAPGAGAYGMNTRTTDEIPMADADHALDFWGARSLPTFKDNHQVIFHAFDEPHAIDWPCALNGCAANDAPQGKPRFGAYTATGHQAIVDAIRSTGATQPIDVSGIDFAGKLDQWEQFMPTDPLGQLVVGFNSFDYSRNFSSSKPDLARLASLHPVLIGGFGDTNCTSRFSSKLMKFADRIGISYLAWTWNAVQDYGGCSNALLDSGPKARRVAPISAGCQAVSVAESVPISGRSRPASGSEALDRGSLIRRGIAVRAPGLTHYSRQRIGPSQVPRRCCWSLGEASTSSRLSLKSRSNPTNSHSRSRSSRYRHTSARTDRGGAARRRTAARSARGFRGRGFAGTFGSLRAERRVAPCSHLRSDQSTDRQGGYDGEHCHLRRHSPGRLQRPARLGAAPLCRAHRPGRLGVAARESLAMFAPGGHPAGS